MAVTNRDRQPRAFANGIAWEVLFPHLLVVALAASAFRPETFSWLGVWLAAAMFLITGWLGVTLCYHRLLTHRAFKTFPWVRNVLALFGALSGQLGPIVWAGLHRIHHQTSDREGDPHSPNRDVTHWRRWLRWLPRTGWFLYAHVGWLWERRSREANREILRVTQDLQKEKFLRWLHRYYPLLHVATFGVLFLIGALVGFLSGGFRAALQLGISVIVWQGVRLFVAYNVTFAINSWTHLFGYRLYRTSDNSRNDPVLGLISGGEALHNTHHAFPNTAKNSTRWWEIDITYGIIAALRAVGAAWDVTVPSKPELQAKSVLGTSPEGTG